jgi:hypothetical protein
VSPDPALRAHLLAMRPEDVNLAPTPELPHVWAALMEMAVSQATATLVAVADGTTSLYVSTGGGIIGGGEHETVRAESRKFLAAVEQLLPGFVKVDEPLPVMNGAISFTALTYDGRYGVRDTEARLKDRKSPAWPLVYLGHGVLTAVRLTAEKKRP